MFSAGTPRRTPAGRSIAGAARASPAPATASETGSSMAGANTNMALVESATPTRRKATNQRILRGPATPLAGSSRPALLDADVDMGRTDEQDSAERLSEGTVLVKDDINAVTVYSNLPVELHQILESADLYIDAFTGALDVQTGFAYIVSRTACYVWSFVNHGFASPTCYTFALSSSSVTTSAIAIQSLPFCGLVPRRSGREPGLVLVYPSGQVRFWDGVEASLTGADRMQSLSIPVGYEETVSEFVRLESNTFVIATTQSRLFRLSILSQGGRAQAQIASFSRPLGVFGRLFGSASSFGIGNEGIVALAIGAADEERGGRDLFAMGQKGVQKWRVTEGGGEKLLVEQEIRQMIGASMFQTSEIPAAAAERTGLELVDATSSRTGSLVVLFSYKTSSEEPLSYGIASLDLVPNANTFVVTSTIGLSYREHRDPRPYSTPRLVLPYGGPAAFIVFANVIVMRALEEDVDFEEEVSLSDDRNRILGVGTEPVEGESEVAVAPLSCITAKSGALLVEFNAEHARAQAIEQGSAADRQLARTERLKLKIEHAVFYGGNELNPLSFDLPAKYEGDLQTAVEQLSADILSSSSPNMPTIVDLRTQLADRLMRLSTLINFINSNGLLGKLSQSCRRRLCSDAELLAAANDLWNYQNTYARESHAKQRARAESPLGEAIFKVMTERGEGFVGEDIVRLFFRQRISNLVDVLEHLLKHVKAVLSSSADVETRSSELLEANRIILTAYNAAQRHRKDYNVLYGINDSPVAFEPWTSRPVCLELLETLFHATDKLIRDRKRELGSSIDVIRDEWAGRAEDELGAQQRVQQEFKRQLCELADFALTVFEERLAFLDAASSDAAYERELHVLQGRHRNVRPQMIHPLVTIGRSDRAFALAERHRDFRTLTELCNEPTVGGSNSRIQYYLQKYRQAFAFELYQWYIEQGQLRTLLEQDSMYGDLLSEFLDATDNPRIAWLHDIALERYDVASETLLREATNEKGVEEKKLMLSLGKLAYVAELNEVQIAIQGEQDTIEVIDDQIDLLNVHHRLRGFLGIPELGDGTSDIDATAEEIAATQATLLAAAPAFRLHFLGLVKRLLRGEVLSSEDLIDLLTLKDTPQERVRDFVEALEVYIRVKDVPETRLHDALRSIWRRALLRDDWVSLTNTTSISDDQLADRLRTTALYAILRAISSNEMFDGAILHPTDCLSAPSAESISARLPGLPEQQVDLLLNEHHSEVERLRELVDGEGEGQVRLATWWDEVGRLVELDGALGDGEADPDADEDGDGEGDALLMERAGEEMHGVMKEGEQEMHGEYEESMDM